MDCRLTSSYVMTPILSVITAIVLAGCGTNLGAVGGSGEDSSLYHISQQQDEIAGTDSTTSDGIAEKDGSASDQDGSGDTAVEDVQEATWLIIAGTERSLVFTATAFGVQANLLATNAHVAHAMMDVFSDSTAVAYAIQHETGDLRSITRVWAHPDYDADDAARTPDVGLLEVDNDIPSCLALADDRTHHELAVFDEVSLCGFPGDLALTLDIDGVRTGADVRDMDLHPRATCLTGTISALRPFDPSVPSTPENTQLLQYDLPIAAGTSGSPVFGAEGTVIGINAAGLSGDGEFNFAVRTDLLRVLLEQVEEGTCAATVLSEIAKAGKELCLNTCMYAGDGECDDGGVGSDYAVCEFGTDCLDCGDRAQAGNRPDGGGHPNGDESNNGDDNVGEIRPGIGIGPLTLEDVWTEVLSQLGAPDKVRVSQYTWSIFFEYGDLGIHGVVEDDDHDENIDAIEKVDGLFAWPPFEGTYRGVGLGAFAHAVRRVMGAPEEESAGDYWYWSRGILWGMSQGVVDHIYVFPPHGSALANTSTFAAARWERRTRAQEAVAGQQDK